MASKNSKVASSSELSKALNDVTSSEGASIELTEDVKLDEKLTISGKGNEVTLDLNDKAITGESSSGPLLTVSEGSTLNIKGGTVEGTMPASGSGSSSLVNVNDNSVMNLEDVTLSAKSDGATLSMMGDNAEVNISGGEIKTTSYNGFGIVTNGSETKNGKITIKDTKITSNSYALYLPGDADVEIINCEVKGWTVITGGKTKISGGSYTGSLLSYSSQYNVTYNYSIYDNFKNSSANNLINNTYSSITNDNKYYFSLDAAKSYYDAAVGVCGCLFDTITVVENRNGNYPFTSFEISDAKIGITNRTTNSTSNDIIFGVRYVNGADNTKYESENVTLTNCTNNGGADYTYSAEFFKTLNA